MLKLKHTNLHIEKGKFVCICFQDWRPYVSQIVTIQTDQERFSALILDVEWKPFAEIPMALDHLCCTEEQIKDSPPFQSSDEIHANQYISFLHLKRTRGLESFLPPSPPSGKP